MEATRGYAERLVTGMARMSLAVGILGCCVAASVPANAETWPARPIAVVVPYAAGGTVDRVARLVQDGLHTRLSQTVIVDNKPGAGGTIGTGQLARSKPDGYTVGMVFDGFAAEGHIYPKLPYHGQRDLTGVSYMVRSPMVLVVPAAFAYRNLDEYVAATRSTKAVSYASVGPGSSNHLVAEAFFEAAGTNGVHTPYKGGGPAINDLLGGHVDSMIASLPLILPYVQSGKLRALAVTSPQRDSRLPSVPALAERYKGFEAYSWVAMIAPSKTPQPILEKLTSAATATLRDPGVSKQLGDAGFDVVAGDASQTNALIQAESARWGRLIKARKITLE